MCFPSILMMRPARAWSRWCGATGEGLRSKQHGAHLCSAVWCMCAVYVPACSGSWYRCMRLHLQVPASGCWHGWHTLLYSALCYPSSRHPSPFALCCCRQLVPHVRLAGPTSFAPAIQHACKVVNDSGGKFHILLIIADGQVGRLQYRYFECHMQQVTVSQCTMRKSWVALAALRIPVMHT